jgi:hypothetical protein
VRQKITIDYSQSYTSKLSSSEFGDALGVRDQVELTDALGGRDQASLEMHLEAEIV